MKKFTITGKHSTQTFDLIVERNKSIQIDCIYKNSHNPVPTSVKFEIGDQSEFFHLKY